MPERFYVTAAITYPNAEPHLGTVYEWVGCDVLARYYRLRGFDVRYTAGSDEHSQSVERAARAQGITTEEFCNLGAAKIRGIIEISGCAPTTFVRTGSAENADTATNLWNAVSEAGFIYKAPYRGWFCPSCEQFYTEKDLAPGNLCPLHQRPTDLVEEDNWFFELSAFADKLLAFYEENPEFIMPETRRNEMFNIVRQGLMDISISRGFSSWGIPVPGDPEQVIWVWFDALPSYMTAIGYLHHPDEFGNFWPADVHVVGKDIARFHCITWPAMLMAAGLPLPKKVHAHGWVTVGGEKMSKSRGIFVDPAQLISQFGSDAVRYFLMAEIPFDRDGDFSLELFVDRYNADLANDYGNLVSRTEKMIGRYFGGALPGPGNSDPIDQELANLSKVVIQAYETMMRDLDFSGALAEARKLVGRANKYIEETAPWILYKSEDSRLATVLRELAEAIRVSTILLHPFIPVATTQVARDLGLDLNSDVAEQLQRWNVLGDGLQIGVGEILFPRLDRTAVLADDATVQAV